MEIATLAKVLDHPNLAADYLHAWGLRDVPRGRQMLLELAESGLTLDLLASVCRQLADHLPHTADPDAALAAFQRYLLAVRSPLGLAALFDRDPSAMPALLTSLSLGDQWTELLVHDPEVFDLVRQTASLALDQQTIVGEALAEVEPFQDERAIVAALARIWRRHRLRIAYLEVAAGAPLESTMRQLSQLNEAIIEAALTAALRKVQETKAWPQRLDPRTMRVGVIALGDLGAGESSYFSPLELLFVYEAAVVDAAALRTLHEPFDRAARLMLRYLNEASPPEAALTARLIALPDSTIAAAAHTAEDTVIGFDSFGRTWHREQMIKARSVGGDRELATALLGRLDTWLYRRYLGRADESGIKALKRRILIEATIHQDNCRSVRLARGGLRDIESTVVFLQLLVAGEQPAVRQTGTLAALAGLERAGALTPQERTLLEDAFVFLRRLQHRQQIMLGPAVGALPNDEAVIAQIADALGHTGNTASFLAALKQRLDSTWQTLHKLLTSAFAEEPPAPREVDLLLHPAPPAEETRAALAPFGFQQPEAALATLGDLATEQVPFLSTRRCRHLLASILPRFLCAVSATPDPDGTLDNLARVSNSLGGKGVLWDLLRSHPPSLDLYVKLCAASPYLSDILMTNPGMIDELVDSLQLDKLPTYAELQATLDELCRGAADTLPILHDFKNAEHLRIGVRDILGKEDIDRTHEALADVAEICLAHVAQLEYARLVEKFGIPTLGPGASEGQPCRLVIAGLRKLGGREPNYHSHLDVLFLYEGEGTTRPPERWRRVERTANNHFFTQLAQRIIKQLTQLTPKGRLYPIDALLRPIGIGGALALPFGELAQHFAGGAAPLWQWQSLCQARPVFGEPAACDVIAGLIRRLLIERPWHDADGTEIRRLRSQLAHHASPNNLKRAAGGTLDVEFIVQMLQLHHAGAKPGILLTNTQSALVALAAAGLLGRNTAAELGESYRFLRRVEAGLRLLNLPERHNLPDDRHELDRLALLIGHSNPDRLREQCLQFMAANRALFDRLTT